LAGETEILGENLSQHHFVHHKISNDQTRARTPDRSGGKPATNRLSYDTALLVVIVVVFVVVVVVIVRVVVVVVVVVEVA
jgi:hypothetical protein